MFEFSKIISILEKVKKTRMRKRARIKLHCRLAFLIIKSRLARPALSVRSGMALAGAAALLFLFIVPVYAYAGKTIMPGHPLYGLRKTMEQVVARTAIGEKNKAEHAIKLSNRRLEESKYMRRLDETGTAALLLRQSVSDLLDAEEICGKVLDGMEQDDLCENISEAKNNLAGYIGSLGPDQVDWDIAGQLLEVLGQRRTGTQTEEAYVIPNGADAVYNNGTDASATAAGGGDQSGYRPSENIREAEQPASDYGIEDLSDNDEAIGTENQNYSVPVIDGKESAGQDALTPSAQPEDAEDGSREIPAAELGAKTGQEADTDTGQLTDNVPNEPAINGSQDASEEAENPQSEQSGTSGGNGQKR